MMPSFDLYRRSPSHLSDPNVKFQISDTFSVCAHSSCPIILANMAEEEVARLVVGHDSGMYSACFAGDVTPRAWLVTTLSWLYDADIQAKLN